MNFQENQALKSERHGNNTEKKEKIRTFGLGITLERRLEERSSSIASVKPVPMEEKCSSNTNMKTIQLTVTT